MPLDMTLPKMLAELPENLNFDIRFEPTKIPDQKYVINNLTDKPLAIVGSGFNCASHSDFFSQVQDAMADNLDPSVLVNVDTNWKVCRNNAWALMDMRLNDVFAEIRTDKHETKIHPRIVALHGVDGSCSNQVHFGKIDAFCTNGMISGTFESVKRKNTSGFSLDVFIEKLRAVRNDFYSETDRLQRWANTDITSVAVDELIKDIVGTQRKSDKMVDLYKSEASVRGHNVFALYSAFTNYASFADTRNGFSLKNTGKDTNASSMWSREQEVTRWVSSKSFTSLLSA